MSSYKEAGVDLQKNTKLKEDIKKLVRSTFTKNVVGDVGLFGGLFDISELKNYDNPVLVASTDGVGTKLAVAKMMNKWDTVGIDLVNHCINDILVQGAKPLFFLDYIAGQKLEGEVTSDIVKGLSNACKEANIALIGGETAEMPGTYSEGEYDLAGTIVGIVDKKDIIDGSKIKKGDVLIGIPSSGLHTNGYSLARKVLLKDADAKTKQVLLVPHRSYLKEIYPLRNKIKGMAHITGGGFTENIPRIIPKGLGVEIKKSWKILPIFQLIQEKGNISDDEMFKTFNMGIGLVLVVSPEEESNILKKINGSVKIGEVVSGGGVNVR
ncbi:MAG TPA: phosphoribosylformylglycinamidine cyclo-ligase [Candidatus Nanoarchaeia archaeon]|nr:phosphoribosylformylglycinamidine cyclo-ligase [Candidatus Nanoarchaeia archaeon]